MKIEKSNKKRIYHIVNELCEIAPTLTHYLPLTERYGSRMCGGCMYYITTDFADKVSHLAKVILKALPENTVTTKDIDDLLWNIVTQKTKKKNLDCGLSFLNLLENCNFKPGSFIIDDHIIELHGLDKFTAGAITIERKTSVLDELNQYIAKANNKQWMQYNIEHLAFVQNKDVEFAFKVRLDECFANPENAALKLVNAFLTLYRIFRLSEPAVYAIDGVNFNGRTESMPFIDTYGNGRNRGFCLSPNWFWGNGWTAPVRYIISEKTLQETRGFPFKELSSKLLDYKNLDTTKFQFQIFVALQWMSRARQTYINAEKYLFNFNALETVLCGGHKSEKIDGIAQTISDNVEVLVATKRGRISKVVKKFYDNRSKIVHAGDTKFSEEDVMDAQRMTEDVMYVILTRYKPYLDKLQKTFLEELDRQKHIPKE